MIIIYIIILSYILEYVKKYFKYFIPQIFDSVEKPGQIETRFN